MDQPLVEVKELKKYFPITKGVIFKRNAGSVKAVDGVNFSIPKGKTLSLVGESGSGKTTIASLILKLSDPTAGSVLFDGVDITRMNRGNLMSSGIRRRIGVVFQDPYSSLDPRMNAQGIISEPLDVYNVGDKAYRKEMVYRLLEKVGLSSSDSNKYPHQFSGGQRQRIALARALSLSPDFIVADEAVSALDVSVQAKIINLLIKLRDEMNLTYLFVSHDLGVVQHISHLVAVIYLGKIMEIGPAAEIFSHPRHPYTRVLISSIPVPDYDLMKTRVPVTLKGEIPSASNPPKGCRFNTRCPYAREKCRESEPQLEGVDHLAACFFWETLENSIGDPRSPILT